MTTKSMSYVFVHLSVSRVHFLTVVYMIAGIWDCPSSQDVVSVVRYQVSEAQRNASTSTQSAPSPTLPLSPKDLSAGSASKDETPESKSKLGSNNLNSCEAGGDIVDMKDETEFDDDYDFEEDNGGGSFFMETLKSSSHIQLAGPSISSSVPVIVLPDEHSKSLTDGDTEGENSSSFLIHCISSHPSFHSEKNHHSYPMVML